MRNIACVEPPASHGDGTGTAYVLPTTCGASPCPKQAWDGVHRCAIAQEGHPPFKETASPT